MLQAKKDPLALSFAEILAWEIDFYQDLREGDRFKILAEKNLQRGPVHSIRDDPGGGNMDGVKTIIRGIRYGEDYYSEEGVSLRKAFLKAPLRFEPGSVRSSAERGDTLVLGGVRPHYGVDYAAPIGTPVRVVADGTVLSVGRNGGFGKQVIVPAHEWIQELLWTPFSLWSRDPGKGCV